jgi:hypothetical protein
MWVTGYLKGSEEVSSGDTSEKGDTR